MGYAFISYSTKNQNKADAFRQLLNKSGVETWMAPYDIPVGSEYAEVLYDALIGCSCLLLLLTDDSQNSQWVKKEVNIAITNSKTLIPVKLEEVELNRSMKLYLNDRQIIPVYSLDENSEAVSNVLETVIAITGRKKATQGPPVVQAASTAQWVRKTYFDGVYEGDMVNGKRTGKGKFTWANGDVYEGDFVEDKRTGKGKYTWADGDVYEGDFVEGERTGNGKLTTANGTVQKGRFEDGKFIG